MALLVVIRMMIPCLRMETQHTALQSHLLLRLPTTPHLKALLQRLETYTLRAILYSGRQISLTISEKCQILGLPLYYLACIVANFVGS